MLFRVCSPPSAAEPVRATTPSGDHHPSSSSPQSVDMEIEQQEEDLPANPQHTNM